MNRLSYKTNPMRAQVRDFTSELHRSRSEAKDLRVDSYATRPIGAEELDVRTHKMGKAAVEAALYRGASENESLKMVFMGWGGNFHAGVARLELAEIANKNPESDLLIVNNPGSGDSSPIPREAMREMKRSGSFDPYGEVLGPVVSKYLSDYDRANAYGHSMGSRTLISTLKHLDVSILPGRSIDYLVATDPPGSRKLGLAGLAAAFMQKEGAHTKRYAQNSDNNVSLRLQQENDRSGMKNIVAMGPRGAGQMLFGQAMAMGHDGLRVDLEELAASNKVRAIQINSPEYSELSRPEDVTVILQELAEKFPHIVLRQALLMGQTHSVNVGGNSHTTGVLSRWM